MNTAKRQLLSGLAAVIGAAALPSLAQPAYPGQPIKLLVPFTAGSGTDVIARTVGHEMAKSLGQPIVVDNKPGAGGTLGASQVATATADGYTVLIHSAAHVANAALYPQLKYDTLADFIPVAMLAALPNVLVTAPGSGFSTVAELVKKTKASPGRYTYASAGNGSATHINAEKFRWAAGFDAVHIPFKGTPEALNEVMAGRVDWFFAPQVSALPLIKAGKLVALAVGTPQRSRALPQVPTTTETGFPGSDYTFWVGMFVPAKTSADIVSRLHAETSRALRSKEVIERLQVLGAEGATLSQQEFAALTKAEARSVAEMIKKVGIRVE